MRRPSSEEGSQYEIDVDALGLNSTFESSGLEDSQAPNVDVVDTSDMEGPEDFTMNMTYWMTADLSPSKVKSRKETNVRVEEVHEDMRQHANYTLDSTEEGDKVVMEDTARDRVVSDDFDSASPTMRANGTVDGHDDRTAHSESSMENDEKVMSYLSTLPDTDMPGAISSTPLKIAKGNTLQVPTPIVSKARSLQATVEDYDTPRKPTQDTVIHHTMQEQATEVGNGDVDVDAFRNQIAELQSRLDQQDLAAKTRITELETILSYTKSELDSVRTENYKNKEHIAGLKNQDGHQTDTDARIKEKEQEFGARMQEFGQELRLQNLAKLQNQREDFEKQLRASEEARRIADEQVTRQDGLLAQLRRELEEFQRSKENELQSMKTSHSSELEKHDQEFTQQRKDLTEKLSSLQNRAESLQVALEKATAEAQTARQESKTADEETRTTQTQQSSDPTMIQTYTTRISELESRVKVLQSQLDSARADVSSKDQQLLHNIEDQERLDQRLNAAQGRVEGLETTISTLRQQLADAHRESSKTRTDAERFEQDLEGSTERFEDARREADRRVADVERKLSKMKDLKTEAEARFKELRIEHDNLVDDYEAQLEDVRDKAEDAVRKVGLLLDTERTEKKRIAKELKTTTKELDKVRAETARKAAEEEESETETSILSTLSDSKDVEIENLRTLLRTQAATVKTLKSENISLRKKSRTSTDVQSELEIVRSENESLRSDLKAQRENFDAVNKAMDEKLASMVTKMLKERSKNVVGKRDDQWTESMAKLRNDKELMGRVLMREWGRQECGVANDKENQLYRYQYVKRS
jgi:myosin protein heavy chain